MDRAKTTHEVFNQPPPPVGYNPFDSDLPLLEAMRRCGVEWIEPRARELGARVGSAEVIEWGTLANRHEPELCTFDRYGHRTDEVSFHPAWHQLMKLGVESGLHSLAWKDARPGSHVARAVLYYVISQAEAGIMCPITMTHAAVPALRVQPDIAEVWEPRILRDEYDSRFIPAEDKRGVLFGMAMTEKQGGSDVRANTTRARPLGSGDPGTDYELTGHKWFCSAPMCDAFLTLAQTEGGLSCFLVPRWRPDGTRNPFYIQRLKDKLGNRSNASSEIEYADTYAQLVGEQGRGVRTIISMVHCTRIDCSIGSAAAMSFGVRQALHHAKHRSAFGKRLIEQPLMRNVIADLQLESEAALALAMHVASSNDRGIHGDERGALLSRIATPVAKYWICKRAPWHAAEALECLGGNGYVEESLMPRLYREAPVNSVWEGSGNVQCLDVLRAIRREPQVLDALTEELAEARTADRRIDRFVSALTEEMTRSDDPQRGARRLVEGLALALQATLLARHAPAAVSDAFCATRLDRDWGHAFGTLPAGVDTEAILSRAPVI